MKRLENLTTPAKWFMALALAAIATGCGNDAASPAKAITAYSFAAATGTIDETAKTISVTVPSGTNLTAMVATFTTTGTGVSVGTTAQVSGTTANNFTSPVQYIVTAADGSTATYTVTVTKSPPPGTAKAISVYSLNGYPGTVDEAAKTITIRVTRYYSYSSVTPYTLTLTR